jgi:predicted nucleic acid-binding protein
LILAGGCPLLIDTSILIDHLRGRPDATRFLAATRATVGLTTSVVVAAELLSGARDRREQAEIDRLLARSRVELIYPTDNTNALDLLRQYKLSRGIGWPDCLIAAVAIRLLLPAATLNDRHFRAIPTLSVHRPY